MDLAAPEQQLHPTLQARCGFHHGPVDQCPPLDSELGDLLPDLFARGVDIRLVPASTRVEHCEDCVTARGPINDAVAWVCHRAPSEALPDGFIYRPPVCAEHLLANVTWEQRRGCPTWIEIPA